MISKEVMQHLELLKISTRRIVDNLFAGGYFSIFRGRGTEFLELREYSPGYDDIREIDWNVTARTGQPYVRKFREERNISVMLLVDLSSSMSYGSTESSKGEKVLELAALIGMSVIKNNNRLGLIGFTDRVEAFLMPGCGRKQFYRMLDSLSSVKTKGMRTDIGKALKFMNRIVKKKAVVFLISDFISEEYSKVLMASARRYDLVPVIVTDPVEQELPAVGLIEVADSESGEVVVVDSSDHPFRRHHHELIRDRKKGLDELFRSAGIDSVRVSTGSSVLPPLKEFFYRRARNRGNR